MTMETRLLLAFLLMGLVLFGTRIWAAVHFESAPANALKIEVPHQTRQLGASSTGLEQSVSLL